MFCSRRARQNAFRYTIGNAQEMRTDMTDVDSGATRPLGYRVHSVSYNPFVRGRTQPKKGGGVGFASS